VINHKTCLLDSVSVADIIIFIAVIIHIAYARELHTVPITPAKRKLLPKPCPICGDKYGMFQLVLFNSKYKFSRHNITCRIRHYNSGLHAQIRKNIRKGKGARTLYKGQWHSFQMDESVKGITEPSGEIYHGMNIFKKQARLI
jgi:hypothetical protein